MELFWLPREDAAADYDFDHGSNKNSKLHLLHCGVLRRLPAIMSLTGHQVLRNSSGSLAMLPQSGAPSGYGPRDLGVELPFFNERGKLNRAVVQDFDAGGGASNAHGANWRRNFHAARLSNRACNESKCAFRKTH